MSMRYTILRWKEAAGLTEATVTRQVTTKRMRRPSKAVKLAQQDQWKRRRQTRVRDIFAKEEAVAEAISSATNARDVVIAQLADQIFSKGHRHLCSAMNVSFVPDGNPAVPTVALAGRGGVGKTSLLRSLVRSASEVGRSNRRLRRDAMNYFSVGNIFNIVDLPGFGGTSLPWSTVLQHAVLLRNFVRYQPSLKMLYYCMDVHYKHGVYIQDIDTLHFLSREVPNFTIVLTKADQINGGSGSTRTLRLEDIRRELIHNDIFHPVLATSAYHMGGMDTLRFDMVMNCLHALPTERLTMTEARKLSDRLFSQKELGTVRQLCIPPTAVDDDIREWKRGVDEERRSLPKVQNDGQGAGTDHESATSQTAMKQDKGQSPLSVQEEFSVAIAVTADRVQPAAIASRDDEKAVQLFADPDRQVAYASLLKKMRNKPYMQYVERTSPWRNPLLWPRHVVPTKHPRSNIMRSPEDPENPYLTQPQFVAPRADMYFRRPNVGLRRSSQKGRYESDKPTAFLVKPYTIPYFPDIVDTNMHPLPWTFLGSREAFYERSGGRQLGVRLSNYVTHGHIDPISDSPSPELPLLAQEVRTLEQKRFGSPIAMLQPPARGEASHSTPLSLDKSAK